MQLSKILNTGAIRVRWPTVIGEISSNSSELDVSETCKKKCQNYLACQTQTEPGEHQCHHGMTYFVTHIKPERILVYGVRGASNTTPLNKYTKEGLKGRSLQLTEFMTWAQTLKKLITSIEHEFANRQAEMLDPLHDPIRLAKQVNTIANRLVQINSHGTSFDQQISNASFELKTLVKASDLLSDSFDLLTIYFNPNAATFGRKSAVSLHGLITKLIAIFRIDDEGITRSSAKIYSHGSCFRNIFVYESFKLIPFALLSNAVKYSIQGNIDVTIDDRRDHIELSVTSIGPPIDDDEKERIFQKGGRGRWATSISGRGVGLYLAQIIATAHGTRISVNSTRTGTMNDGNPLAKNTFSLQLKIA